MHEHVADCSRPHFRTLLIAFRHVCVVLPDSRCKPEDAADLELSYRSLAGCQIYADEFSPLLNSKANIQLKTFMIRFGS